MNVLNKILRKKINRINKSRLNNKNFSLISSNCTGAFILHDLEIRFNSPFVNLWMKPNDFIKYLKNIKYYCNCKLDFIKEDGVLYPIGILDDIKIYFQHYKSCEEAERKWIERTKRINFDNLFIIFTDRDGCTYQNLLDFDALSYKNKIVFTHKEYPEIKSSYYLECNEDEKCVGLCFEFVGKFSGKRFYDDFDYVSWFNKND